MPGSRSALEKRDSSPGWFDPATVAESCDYAPREGLAPLPDDSLLSHGRDGWVMLTGAAVDGTRFGVDLEAEARSGADGRGPTR